MSSSKKTGVTRRDIIKNTGKAAAVSAFAGMTVPHVYAQEDNTIQLALVGCGGRGTGAAIDAMSSQTGPTKLVAMADVFQDRLTSSHRNVSQGRERQVDVPEGRRFIGFDGYRHAMDSLRPGDVVILTTPPAFRWVMFSYAIEKGLNVFMEKPTTVDGPSTRRMLALAEASERRGLKVGVGLMCRHCEARKALLQRIKDGEIGEIQLMRAYRMHGPVATFASPPKPEGMDELEYQIRRFHSFLWLSGGAYSDFNIHNIDEMCMMKEAWPVSAKGSGGRHFRGNNIDQNFDSYSTEFTFADGTKAYMEGRCIVGCHNEFAVYAHGTRGSAIVSYSGHTPARSRTFRSQRIDNSPTNPDIIWRAPRQEPNPYRLEWDHLLSAIRNNRPWNEARRGAEASLITALGRAACHTGRVITRDEMLNSEQEFAPNVDRLTLNGPSPLQAGADGKYPVPQPGQLGAREY